MPSQYNLDLTGSNPNNLVQNELHTVTEAHFRDYYFIVPNFAPFFVDNFSMTITINNVTTQLAEDVDFSFALPDVTRTRVTGKALYGAVTLHNLNLNGILSITYQTIGGDHIADRLLVLTSLAEKAYNPRTTIFDILEGVPQSFPPTPHYQDYDNFMGQEEVVNKLGEIRDAIIANSSLTQNEIQQFLNIINTGNFASYIKKAGDTMTGPLTLSGNPVNDLHASTKQYVDNTTVSKSGDTMTGPLTLSGNPVNNLHAATKQYVDNTTVSKSGGTMTGLLTLSGNPVNNLHAATKQYVDNTTVSKSGGTMTGLLTLSGDPINGLHAATKQYVDNTTVNISQLSGYATKQYVDDKFNDLLAYIQNIVLSN